MTRTVDTTGTARAGGRTTGWGRWRGLTLATVTMVVLALVGVVPATPALAANTGGTVTAWGDNSYGQLEVPPGCPE